MTTIAEEDRRRERRTRRCLRGKGPSQRPYHHIPCSAALDFARTATPGQPDPVKAHRLTLPVVEQYTKDLTLEIGKPPPHASRLHNIPTMDVLGKAGEKDLSRRVTQRNVDLSRYRFTAAQLLIPPVTTGEESGAEHLRWASSHRRHSLSLQLVPTDRPDWTEQDECSKSTLTSVLCKFGPTLRKSESIWSMRSHSKHFENVTPDDSSVLNMRARRFCYPWNCVCFS
ncbi:hypothetical protein B9Z19DRAFT_1069701 [Tuber borchii]|uniref:Uncharacterized protein n=1 Tax=Tuber borchii TaxID=42251 RepID=A0A2T6ZAL9_TUBBO|nr:hypothetical protein B9Z19DRAFT_1069701 [Tuber borchii]